MEKDTKKIVSDISQHGFPQVKIFKAVNGKELGKTITDSSHELVENTKTVEEKYGLVKNMLTIFALQKLLKNEERRYHAELGTWGAVGCYLSHMLLWEQLTLDSKNNYYIIFEDDIRFNSNFKKLYAKCMENVPEKWDIIFLDVLWNERGEKYNEHFTCVDGHFFGTHAYIINKECAKKFLTRVLPVEIQIDSYMSYFGIQNNMNYFTATDLCSQKIHTSSIQNVCIICDIDSKSINVINTYICHIVLIVILILVIITYLSYRYIKSIRK